MLNFWVFGSQIRELQFYLPTPYIQYNIIFYVSEYCVITSNNTNHMFVGNTNSSKTIRNPMIGREKIVCLDNTYFQGTVHLTKTLRKLYAFTKNVPFVDKDPQIIKQNILMHTIFISNTNVINSHFILSDVEIVFFNCSLYNVLIDDKATAKNDTLGHIQITIIGSSFQCDIASDQNFCGIKLESLSVVKIFIGETSLNSCKFIISSNDILLIIMDSILSVITFSIITRFDLSIINISDTKISQSSFNLQTKLDFVLRNPYVTMDNCSFDHISLEIKDVNGHSQREFSRLQITKSTFLNTSKKGNGGALSILSQVKNTIVRLFQVSFIGNKANRLSGAIPGKGGAVSVEGHSVLLSVDSCTSNGNFADDQGSSLYASQGVAIEIYNTSFLMELNKSAAYPLVSIFGKSSRLVGHFSINHSYLDLYNSDVKMLSIEQAFGDFIFSVHCPPWHRHTMQYQVETSGTVMQNISVLNNFMYDCRVCPEGFYVVSSHNKVVMYSGNISSKAMADCLECPYGAHCSGNNIIPRPNYWGYWKQNKLSFLQCPAEYCCSGSKSAPCVKYNSCANTPQKPPSESELLQKFMVSKFFCVHSEVTSEVIRYFWQMTNIFNIWYFNHHN